MHKVIAILNVIAWSGFWAFGYIALTATDLSQAQILTATGLAGLGFLTGIGAYLALANAQSNNSAPAHRLATQEG